jgi:hypothetical protein
MSFGYEGSKDSMGARGRTVVREICKKLGGRIFGVAGEMSKYEKTFSQSRAFSFAENRTTEAYEEKEVKEHGVN